MVFANKNEYRDENSNKKHVWIKKYGAGQAINDFPNKK